MNELMENEELIGQMAEVPNFEINVADFKVSKDSEMCAIDFIRENDVTLDTWIEEADSSDKVVKILKIWFQFYANHNAQSWCNLPQVLDDSLFMTEAKKVLDDEAQSLCKPILIGLTEYRSFHTTDNRKPGLQ